MNRIRSLQTLTALLLLASCEDGTAPEGPGVPAALVVVSGNEQADTVGHELPEPLVVRVDDAAGNPIAGQLVNFVVTAGGGSVFAGAALTNDDGVARERWTLGTSTADSQRVEARAVDPETGEKLVFAAFEARALADTPDTIGVVGQGERSGMVGEAVAEPLAVRVTDRFGNPVPATRVAWSTDAAGGGFDPETALTDSAGLAATVWTLGHEAGAQTARASLAALEATFTASVAPGPVADVTLDADSIRFGALRSTRQVSAHATDEFGNVVPGVTAVWTSTDPGVVAVGQSGAVTSIGNGNAHVVASIGAASDTAHVAVAQVLHAVALTPAGDTLLIGDSVRFVAAGADSNGFAIAGAPSGTWTSADASIARVDASGMGSAAARGVTTIRFDAATAAAEAIVRVMRPDTVPPTLVVHHPLQYAVARPELRIAATCTDDDPEGCVSIDVFIHGTLAFSHAGGAVDTVVSLGHLDGRAVTMYVHGRDPMRATVVRRDVYVESSTALHEEEVVAGVILDAAAGRLLVWDSTGSGGTLRIHDRASGSADTIRTGLTSRPPYAYLTGRGAVWEEDDGSASVVESRDGSLVDHGLITPEYTLRVDGDYAIWQVNQTLRRLDVAARAVTDVSTISGNNSNDVAANGDVVFWTTGGYDIHRYRAGSVTQITADSAQWSTYPVTDGARIVYRRHDPCCSAQQYQLVLWTDTGSVELTTRTSQQHSQDLHYRIENGWVAFIRFTDAGRELWSRSPVGVEQLVASSGSSIDIEALGPNGAVVFGSSGRRYLWTPTVGGSPRDIGYRLGRVRFIGDVPHVFLGGTLFRVE